VGLEGDPLVFTHVDSVELDEVAVVFLIQFNHFDGDNRLNLLVLLEAQFVFVFGFAPSYRFNQISSLNK